MDWSEREKHKVLEVMDRQARMARHHDIWELVEDFIELGGEDPAAFHALLIERYGSPGFGPLPSFGRSPRKELSGRRQVDIPVREYSHSSSDRKGVSLVERGSRGVAQSTSFHPDFGKPSAAIAMIPAVVKSQTTDAYVGKAAGESVEESLQEHYLSVAKINKFLNRR